jgi:hypothetical protein
VKSKKKAPVQLSTGAFFTAIAYQPGFCLSVT